MLILVVGDAKTNQQGKSSGERDGIAALLRSWTGQVFIFDLQMGEERALLQKHQLR